MNKKIIFAVVGAVSIIVGIIVGINHRNNKFKELEEGTYIE